VSITFPESREALARQGVSRQSRRSRAACLGALLLLQPMAARAEPGAVVNQYRPPASDEDELTTARPAVGEHLRLQTRLDLDYARDPLVYRAGTQRVALVSDQLTAQLSAALGLFQRGLLFFHLPLNLLLQGSPLGMEPTATGSGAGDFSFGARGLAVSGAGGALGAELSITLPSGAPGEHGRPPVAGDPTASATASLLGEALLGPVRVSLQAGLRMHPRFAILDGPLEDQLIYGLATSVPIGQFVRVSAEVVGSTLSANVGQRSSSPLEALLGVKVRPSERISFGLGGSKGLLVHAYGCPDFRVIAQFGLSFDLRLATISEPQPQAAEPAEDDVSPEPSAAPLQPTAAEPGDEAESAAPIADSDGDGVGDDDDACFAFAGEKPSGCPAGVQYDKHTGAIELTPPASFAPSASGVDPNSLAGLTQLAAALARNPRQRIMLAAHLDPHDRQAKTALSEERARVLTKWLTEHGVASTQIEAYACGGERPRVADKHKNPINERLEFYLLRPLPEFGMPSTLLCTAVEP
jgi:outer membrane protein OmpA-like peptidoglycan-associated protein